MTLHQPIHTLYREPFSIGAPHIQAYPEGASVQKLVNQALYLPDDFEVYGEVCVEGIVVPREMWSRVRPKSGMVVTFHTRVEGGDGGGGKQVFALVAAIALTVATAGISSGALAPVLGSSFAAGTLGAGLLAAGVGLAGSLAIAALTSPPVVRPQEESANAGGRRLEAASVEGNVLEPNAPIPRVIGTRRVYPPFGSEPVVELDGQDEYVEAFYVLAGPHDLDDFRLGDASIELDPTEDKDVDIQIRNGLPGESALTLITRQGRTLDINTEMSTHIVDAENEDTLSGSNPLPVFHAMTTRIAPDENWIHFSLAGLIRQNNETDRLRIPIRMRMRKRGDTEWRDLPEIQYENVTQSLVRLQFKIYWGSAFSDNLTAAPGTTGFVMARKVVPAQDVAPTGTEFTADDYFSAGAGNDYYDSTNADTTNVQNIVLFGDRVDIYLDEDEWDPGIYDIEIKRGEVFRATLFTNSSYDYNGDVLDFFGQIQAGTLPVSRAGLLDSLTIVRLVNVWNEYPIQQAGLATIAVRARNRSVRRLSTVASGYVYDQPLARGPHFKKSSGDGNYAWSWDEVGFVTNVEVLALIRIVAVNTTTPQSIAIAVRGGGSLGSEDNYQLQLRRSADDGSMDELSIHKSVSGTFTVLVGVPFKYEVGRNYFLRFRANGSTLQGKAWPASLPEPSDWMVETTDTDLAGTGWVGLFGYYQAEQNHCNWFSVGLDGSSAPFPPDISSALATDFSEYVLASGDDLNDWTSQYDPDTTSEIEESLYLPYNGESTDWDELRITSNPAPHFRDVLTGVLNLDPLPLEIFDDAGIIAWRQRCAASDFTCNMVVEGLEVSDLLRVVSSCGYARLYRSELWGVTEDKSRKNDTPIQLFSPRNSSNFTWRKAFARLPTGFRVNFREEDDDYIKDQIIVYRAGSEGSGARLEQVTYDGLVTSDDIIRRARFDLLQSEKRSTFYTFNAPVESIVCRRGSLIALNHDTLRRQYGYARVADTIVSDGKVTDILLDAPIEVYNIDDVLETVDILLVTDVLELGIKTGISIRKTTGEITVHPVANDTGFTDEIELTTPVKFIKSFGSPFDSAAVPEIDRGCLVAAGIVDNEYKRLLVSEIQTLPDLEAQLICVDEASDIFDEVFNPSFDVDYNKHIVNAVSFDGANDYLTRGAGLTGAADSGSCTFSFWINISDLPSGNKHILSFDNAGPNARFVIFYSMTGAVRIFARNSAGTTILDLTTDTTLVPGNFHHVCGSIDLSNAGNRHIFINDLESDLTVAVYTDDDIDFTSSDAAIGGRIDGSQLLEGSLAEFWLEDGVFTDFSTESNRRKFINSNIKPVDLGSNGSNPTGYQPLVYMSGSTDAWHTNKGTGGGFTENGALSTASSSPSD